MWTATVTAGTLVTKNEPNALPDDGKCKITVDKPFPGEAYSPIRVSLQSYELEVRNDCVHAFHVAAPAATHFHLQVAANVCCAAYLYSANVAAQRCRLLRPALLVAPAPALAPAPSRHLPSLQVK